MPGNIQSITGQLDAYPLARYISFETTQAIDVALTEYPDGSSQTKAKSSNPRRSWKVVHRLQASELATLKAFWSSHLSSPFTYVDVTTGITFQAIFTGAWQEQWQLNKYIVELSILEAA